MNLLVADVGGTNTRIALVADDGALSGLRRFANDDFPSFDAVLTLCIDQMDVSDLTGCSIAIAGPVKAGAAQLTNRGWGFDRGAIAALLGLVSPDSVFLVNDLMALGYALPGLSPSQKVLIRGSSQAACLNNQALVVGVGTGFNACITNSDRGNFSVNAAELGHASLPVSVYTLLAAEIGSEAGWFRTNEHLFSGSGLARLYRVLSGGTEKTGPQILAGSGPGQRGAESRTVDLFAQALGVATREFVFQYLPYSGIYFAGSVARGVLGSPARSVFLESLNAPGPFGDHIAMVPVGMITDDAAALHGAAQFAPA